MIGRKTLKSERARGRQIDIFFERTAQVMLLSYALFAFMSWLSYRPAFHVTEVVIEGLHAVGKDDIIKVTGEALSSQFLSRVHRNNMLLYPREKIQSEISALDPRIASVYLSFDSRHNLRITVREHNVAALFCQSPDTRVFTIAIPEDTSTSLDTQVTSGDQSVHCYYADDQGYIFAEAANWSGYPYMTFVSSSTAQSLRTHILPKKEYAHIQQFLASLAAIDLHPHTVTILGNNDFRINTSLPWDILWSSEKDPQKSTDNLSLVLNSLQTLDEKKKKELQSIDLRFGDKIFYK